MTGDRRLAAHALVQRGLLRLFTEPDTRLQGGPPGCPTGDRGVRDLDDDLGLARAWRLLGQAHYLARRGALSAEANERALGYALRAGDRLRGARDRRVAACRPHPRADAGPDAIERCERPSSRPATLLSFGRRSSLPWHRSSQCRTDGRGHRVRDGEPGNHGRPGGVDLDRHVLGGVSSISGGRSRCGRA